MHGGCAVVTSRRARTMPIWKVASLADNTVRPTCSAGTSIWMWKDGASCSRFQVLHTFFRRLCRERSFRATTEP